MIARMKITCLVLCSLVILFSGCVATSDQFVGNSIAPDQPIIALKAGGPHADSWQNFDIIIDYQYKQAGDNFDISGTAALTPRYEMLYSHLRDLRVFLFMLDKDARVLQAQMLTRSLTGQLDDTMQFTHVYKLSPGTVSITFGYDGSVSEPQDQTSFYLLPLRK